MRSAGGNLAPDRRPLHFGEPKHTCQCDAPGFAHEAKPRARVSIVALSLETLLGDDGSHVCRQTWQLLTIVLRHLR